MSGPIFACILGFERGVDTLVILLSPHPKLHSTFLLGNFGWPGFWGAFAVDFNARQHRFFGQTVDVSGFAARVSGGCTCG